MFRYPKCESEKTIPLRIRLNKESASTAAGFTQTGGPTTIRKSFNVKHRQTVLTIQDELKTTVLRTTTKLPKILMDCAILAIAQVMEWTLGKEVTPGEIAVLHTDSKDMKWNPPTHPHPGD